MKCGDLIAWRFSHEDMLFEKKNRIGILVSIETFHYVLTDESENRKYRVLQPDVIIVCDWTNEKYINKYTEKEWLKIVIENQDNGGY